MKNTRSSLVVPQAVRSELFWEGLDHLMVELEHLITSDINNSVVHRCAEVMAHAVEHKYQVLGNSTGFIGGPVIGVARPEDYAVQEPLCNGLKGMHAIKFQTIMAPSGLILHAGGPYMRGRHDCCMFIKNGVDPILHDSLVVNGPQMCEYGNSSYSQRVYSDVEFQISTPSGARKAGNTNISEARMSVEWQTMVTKQYFSMPDFKQKLRVKLASVGKTYLAALLLTNLRNCIHPNQIAQVFKSDPPSINEYVELRSLWIAHEERLTYKGV